MLFNTRTNLSFVKLVPNNSFVVAFTILRGGTDNDLLSNNEKKLVEEAFKKIRPQTSKTGGGHDPSAILQSIIQMAGSSGGIKRDTNLLSMMAAGAARPKIQRD